MMYLHIMYSDPLINIYGTPGSPKESVLTPERSFGCTKKGKIVDIIWFLYVA